MEITIPDSDAGVGPRCLRCNYLLIGAPGPNCPECGHVFDPDDPATIRIGFPIPRWARVLMWSPRLPLHVAAVLSFLIILEYRSYPGFPYADPAYGYIYGFPLIAFGFWLLRLIVNTVVRTTYQGFRYRQREVMAWGAMPTLFGIAILLSLTRFPSYFRAWVSWPFMDSFAERCFAMSPDSPLPQPDWIGLYPACKVLRQGPRTIQFEVSNSGWLWDDNSVIVYSPQPPSPSLGEYPWIHLCGNWYTPSYEWSDTPF